MIASSPSKAASSAATLEASLTPTQVRGLKLAKEGNLFLHEPKKWAHLNATVTYARNDRFKERPQKIKFMTTTTAEELKDMGFLQPVETSADEGYEITMAGKVWLLKNK